MASITVDPLRKYQINGEVSQLMCYPLIENVPTTRVAVAGVAGKRHRIMGVTWQSTTTSQGLVVLTSDSVILMGRIYAPPVTAGPFVLNITDSGYAETSTGGEITLEVYNFNVEGSLFYITYTPTI